MTTMDVSAVLEQMQSDLARLSAENAVLREQMANGVQDAATDSLKMAVREFDASRRVAVPGQRMTGPCIALVGDKPCGHIWEDHVGDFDGSRPKVTGHSYRNAERPHPEKRKPRRYYAKEEKAVPVAEEVTEDMLMTVSQAAEALGVKSAEAKQMVADGLLPMLKVGRTVLVKRVGVDKILALAAMEGEV